MLHVDAGRRLLVYSAKCGEPIIEGYILECAPADEGIPCTLLVCTHQTVQGHPAIVSETVSQHHWQLKHTLEDIAGGLGSGTYQGQDVHLGTIT